jgi:putative ABC transport system permease protein
LRFEAEVNSDKKTVIFLELIGLFILLIAWSNSINLATARSQQRSKEVGIRKTLGAEKRQLAGQFLFESAALNGLAFLLASSLVGLVLPFFNRLVDRPLSLGQFGIGWIWLASAILAGTLLSGSYPAFILSSFRPVLALRGSTQGNSRGAVLRKGLVLLQFVLAVMLIVATLILGKQLAFMRNQDLGADIERTLVFKIPPVEGTRLAAAVAREQLAGLAAVADTTVSMGVPGREYPNAVGGVYRQGGSEKEGQVLFLIDSDERYFGFFKIPLLAGRTFSGGQGADRSVVIINEEAAKLLGFENADKAVERYITGIGGETVQVIGVARDYHHKSLRDKIEPIVFMPLLGENPISFDGNFFLSLKTRGAAIGEVLSAVEKKWRTLFPGQPLDYFFLDAEFNRQYDADRRFAQVFGLASLLAIAIACLGLFGLAAFSAERRFREIGIRKVFGASFREIATMLSWEFSRWVLLANLLAWPLAYVVMTGWQQEFAYRAPFGIGVFLLAGALSLTIALLTVGFQAIRAARANPVDSLKYE